MYQESELGHIYEDEETFDGDSHNKLKPKLKIKTSLTRGFSIENLKKAAAYKPKTRRETPKSRNQSIDPMGNELPDLISPTSYNKTALSRDEISKRYS